MGLAQLSVMAGCVPVDVPFGFVSLHYSSQKSVRYPFSLMSLKVVSVVPIMY